MVAIDEAKATYWVKKAEESPRAQRAMGYFKDGYNCAQAVAMAYADLIGMDEKLLLRMSSSFGGGMGRMREVCGAVSGMCFVAGALYGYEEPGAVGQEQKAAHYARIQELAAEYRAVNGSIICRELLGLATNGADAPTPELRSAEYYKKRPCGQLVGIAAAIVEEYVQAHPVEAADSQE